MARTFGHVFHRYVGHKLYLAERVALKASLVVDDGADADVDPFWTEAMCVCDVCEACHARLTENQTWLDSWEAFKASEEELYTMRELDMLAAMWAPEPPASDTGRVISVEWEHDTGHRSWETMDEGQLSREIWWNQRNGTMLSDIDEPA